MDYDQEQAAPEQPTLAHGDSVRPVTPHFNERPHDENPHTAPVAEHPSPGIYPEATHGAEPDHMLPAHFPEPAATQSMIVIMAYSTPRTLSTFTTGTGRSSGRFCEYDDVNGFVGSFGGVTGADWNKSGPLRIGVGDALGCGSKDG